MLHTTQLEFDLMKTEPAPALTLEDIAVGFARLTFCLNRLPITQALAGLRKRGLVFDEVFRKERLRLEIAAAS